MDAEAAEVTEDGCLWLGLVLLGSTLQRRRLIVLAGSSVSYWLDCIGWIILAGSYWYWSWVFSYKLAFMCWLVWFNWLATSYMGRTDKMVRGWDGGTDVSRRRNGSTTMGYWGATGVGKRWLAPIRQWCKGVKYFFQSSKIIQICCTQIGTNKYYKIV